MDECVAAAEELEGAAEGFVVYDGVNRLKVKSSAYVELHQHRDKACTPEESAAKIMLGLRSNKPTGHADFDDLVDSAFRRMNNSVANMAHAHAVVWSTVKGDGGRTRKEMAKLIAASGLNKKVLFARLSYESVEPTRTNIAAMEHEVPFRASMLVFEWFCRKLVFSQGRKPRALAKMLDDYKK